MAEKQNDLTRTILGALFIVALIGISLWILLPFLAAIIWATTIVAATWPLMIKIQSWLWGRRGLAVTVMTLILLCRAGGAPVGRHRGDCFERRHHHRLGQIPGPV